jgi:hypothetical protein
MMLIGVDFTSAPTPRKPIIAAYGELGSDGHLKAQRLTKLGSGQAFGDLLEQTGPWLAVMDLPMGLPRDLMHAWGWGPDWASMVRELRGLSRAEFVERLRGFTAARPVGSKFAHRACDIPAGSSPSMKWVNPPVALMLHSALPWLADAPVHLPGLREADRTRVVLEGYPGVLARSVLGRQSYKSDTKAKQTEARTKARLALVLALEHGDTPLGIPVQFEASVREACINDPQGDHLDAVLCLIQAAWSATRVAQGVFGYGLPDDMHPLEGWIATV